MREDLSFAALQRRTWDLQQRQNAIAARQDRERVLDQGLSLEGVARLEAAQERYDQVCREIGSRAPPPLPGETARSYRIRLAEQLKRYSKDWRPVELREINRADRAAFDEAETQILRDTLAKAKDPSLGMIDGVMASRPSRYPREGETMRVVDRKDEAGRDVREYYGKPLWLQQFTLPTRRVESGFHNPDSRDCAMCARTHRR